MKNRQDTATTPESEGLPIWRVPYRPRSDASSLPVELLSFARLRAMDRAGRRRQVQRPEFHVLALVEHGAGAHRCDFVDHRLRPGTVVWIRPGMVHRWSDVERVDGPLLLFPAAVVELPASAVRAASTWRLADDRWRLAMAGVRHLRTEFSAAVGHPALADSTVLRHLLTALLHRVEPDPAGMRDKPAATDVFDRFRAAVDQHHTGRHQVEWYARLLGYSPRTLTRACRAAAGVGAKELVDERIALEAMRLLAHTDLTVSACAARLGFADPANFTTFFQRRTGHPPTAWREIEHRRAGR